MRHLAVALLLAVPTASLGAIDAHAVFLENCATCHGEKGDADTDLGAKYMAQDFTDPKFKKEFTVAKARRVISNGVRKTKMKAWKGILSPAEIDALAHYVLTFPERK